MSLMSCESLKEQKSNLSDLVKANAAIDVGAGPKDGGYEGHVKASTKLFGYEPFFEASTGVRKPVEPEAELVPVVETVK